MMYKDDSRMNMRVCMCEGSKRKKAGHSYKTTPVPVRVHTSGSGEVIQGHTLVEPDLGFIDVTDGWSANRV